MEILVEISIFIVTFLISFNLLRKIKIFSDTISSIFSLILSFYFLLAFYSFKEGLFELFGYISIVFLAFFLAAIFYFIKRE